MNLMDSGERLGIKPQLRRYSQIYHKVKEFHDETTSSSWKKYNEIGTDMR